MPLVEYLIMTNVPSQRWLGTIQRDRQTLGRGKHAKLRVPAEFIHVSRHHAEVWSDEQGCWLCDCESTFGTRVNAVPLSPNEPFQIVYADHIWLGGAELQVVGNPSSNRWHAELEDDATDPQHDGSTGFNPLALHLFKVLTTSELAVMLWMSRGLTDIDEISARLMRSPDPRLRAPRRRRIL